MQTLETIEKYLDFRMPKGFILFDDEYKHQLFGTYSPCELYEL